MKYEWFGECNGVVLFCFQLRRLNELEDVVAEQDNSIAQLRDKLTKARQEIQDWRYKYEDSVKYSAEEKET